VRLGLNKICELKDWQVPEFREQVCWIEPDLARAFPGYPTGREHRKSWEYAQLIRGLNELGVLHPTASILSVASGSERPVFALTKRVRWVFATDIYGEGDFSSREAVPTMLTDPARLATQEFDRNHLVVQYMNATEIHHDDGTFDASFSLSSIEHFGGTQAAVKALLEMGRVTKPGGYVMVATECIVNNQPSLDEPGFHLFDRLEIQEMIEAVAGQLSPIEPVAFDSSPGSCPVIELSQAVVDGRNNKCTYPHILMSHRGRVFTSISLFFERL
jgi:SAM-dependent methyltransferase